MTTCNSFSVPPEVAMFMSSAPVLTVLAVYVPSVCRSRLRRLHKVHVQLGDGQHRPSEDGSEHRHAGAAALVPVHADRRPRRGGREVPAGHAAKPIRVTPGPPVNYSAVWNLPQEHKKSMELDPYARPWTLALALIQTRRFDAALNEARLRSEAHPDSSRLHGLLFCGLLAQGHGERGGPGAGNLPSTRWTKGGRACGAPGLRARRDEGRLGVAIERSQEKGRQGIRFATQFRRILCLPASQRRGAPLPGKSRPGTRTQDGAHTKQWES